MSDLFWMYGDKGPVEVTKGKPILGSYDHYETYKNMFSAKCIHCGCAVKNMCYHNEFFETRDECVADHVAKLTKEKNNFLRKASDIDKLIEETK